MDRVRVMLAIAAILAVLLVAYVGSYSALRLDSKLSPTGVGYFLSDRQLSDEEVDLFRASLTLQTQI